MIKAYGKYTVAKVLPIEETTTSGIILPEEVMDEEKKGCRMAEVVSTKHPDLTVGDIIGYHKYYGSTYVNEGIEYIFLDETGILFKVDK